jgi:signal transduction histidine kinase
MNSVLKRSGLKRNKSKYSLKLQGQFFVYFAGLVFLVVLFVSVAIFYFQKGLLLQQAEEKAIGLTRTLAYTSLNAILQDNYLVLQSLIDSMIEGPDIISIAILDTTGRIIASSTPENRGTLLRDPLTLNALSAEQIILQKESSDPGREVWDTAVPIFQLNRRIATARMKYALEDPFTGLIRSIILIGLLAIALSLILAYRFSRSISQPIRETVRLAAEYGQGNLDASIQMNRQDEIGELVNSLNKLSVELKTLIEEKIANENLVMMGEFASYIIHDLKNPLSGIHLLADGLYRKIPEGSPHKKYSTEILLATQKLHDFVERTLDLSRWNKPNLKPLQVNELLGQTVNDMTNEQIPVNLKLDPQIPVVWADAQLLLMAVRNLLTNALEAISGSGEITVTTHWQNQQVLIEISDTGCGIPADRLKTIFRPFFSMKKQGHGLGLAMVRKVMILHQGKVQVTSREGIGSTFTLSFPGNLHS